MNHAELTRTYISNIRNAISELRIYPRTAKGCEFDHVALGLLSKAFRLSDACMTLVDAQFFDEAYGLSRSLVECAATLRHLTVGLDERDARTKKYVDSFYAEKVYWLHQARSSIKDPRRLQEIEQYASGKKLEDFGIDPKQAVKHWSGLSGFLWKVNENEHPLDSPANPLKLRKSAYAVDYHQTSQYVHCSIWSLWNYYPDTKETYVPNCRAQRYDLNAQMVLFTTIKYLHTCCGYVLFGLGIDRPSQLDQLLSSFEDELEPIIQMEAERLIHGS
ncbi:MAG TPA: DUF5677 domain-containing protein [Edaphobacter sp.]|nr:DUF5677 domain-containing protein [Edaphobacter sp.]